MSSDAAPLALILAALIFIGWTVMFYNIGQEDQKDKDLARIQQLERSEQKWVKQINEQDGKFVQLQDERDRLLKIVLQRAER